MKKLTIEMSDKELAYLGLLYGAVYGANVSAKVPMVLMHIAKKILVAAEETGDEWES